MVFSFYLPSWFLSLSFTVNHSMLIDSCLFRYEGMLSNKVIILFTLIMHNVWIYIKKMQRDSFLLWCIDLVRVNNSASVLSFTITTEVFCFNSLPCRRECYNLLVRFVISGSCLSLIHRNMSYYRSWSREDCTKSSCIIVMQVSSPEGFLSV